MIPALKALHIAALSVWCAGLIALPLLIRNYGREEAVRTQAGFAEFRVLSHRAYTKLVTPAAVIAVAAGTVLIFRLEPPPDWLLAKLFAVAGLVLVHAWLGYLIGRAGEISDGRHMPPALPALLLAVGLMGAVLWLVLAKPELDPLVDRLPGWLQSPQGRELPPDLVPI
jgi:protoporphyrinogen IX oxidase